MIFIAPTSIDVLRDRISKRNTETIEQINKRLDIAEKELSCIDLYDYIIYNNELETAVQDLIHIINTEHNKDDKKEK